MDWEMESPITASKLLFSLKNRPLIDHSLARFCGSTPTTIDSPSRLSPTGNVVKRVRVNGEVAHFRNMLLRY